MKYLEKADLSYAMSRVMIYALVVLAFCVASFPLFWMVITSFKIGGDLYAYPPTFLPVPPTLENYVELFTETNFFLYFKNSLIVSCGATFLSLVIGGLGAYSLSRFTFFGLKTFGGISLFCYMLPSVLLVIPLYVFIVKLRLADTLFVLILSNTVFTLPLTLWFMRSYFNAIPASLEESAMVDGCTRIQALFRVTGPLALPGLVSVGVFSFNHAWNEFLFPLVFTSSERIKVLPVGLATWIGQDSIYSWGMLLGGAFLITIPVVLFYLLVQRKLISGLAEGAVKG